jgi:hypothetical protein
MRAGKYAVIMILSLTGLAGAASAQYSADSALSLLPNGSSSGSMDTSHGEYWWKVAIPSDGKLVVATHAASGLDIDPYMYEKTSGGTYSQIARYDDGSGVDDSTHRFNLRTGTYYINASRYNGSGAYTITSTFTPARLENDIANNDSAAVAVVLQPDGSDTGHLGYYSNSYTDGVDWWKVTIPEDGALFINTLSDSTIEIDNYLYDRDGKSQIAGFDFGGSHPEDQTHRSDLKAGTYWIATYQYNGYGSYSITSRFIPTRLANDVANNDSAAVAVVLQPNGNDTGHLGYYSNGSTDSVDWWKVTIPEDGALFINTLSDSTIEIDNYIYDRDGKFQIAGYDFGGAHPEDQTHRSDLRAGTYWIATYQYNGYGSYSITSRFIPARLENDVADNDSAAAAAPLDKNGSDTGHLGYYSNGYTDDDDWWKVTTTADGKLFVSTLSDSTLEIDLYLYEKNGDNYNQIAGYGVGSGVIETTGFPNLLPGDYYVRAYHDGGYGSYSIVSTFTQARYAIDVEPNDMLPQMWAIPTETVKTGHLGYYGRGYTDIADVIRFNTPSGWDSLCVRISTVSSLEADANFLDHNGDTILSDSRAGKETVFYFANPGEAAYYVNLHYWTGYGSYAVIVSQHWQPPITVNISETILPPTNFTVSDVPGDNGHSLSLSWTTSSSESGGNVMRYRIFRSRVSTLTNPIPLSRFATLDSLLFWEARATILIDSVAAGSTRYTDSGIPLSGVTYSYWIQAVGELSASKLAPAGSGPTTSVAAAPVVFRIDPPYPNPFNPTTTIRFALPSEERVRIVVYDALGRKVAVLADRTMTAGVHDTVWNGRSDSGQTLGSGLYLYRFEAGAHRGNGKMMLLR